MSNKKPVAQGEKYYKNSIMFYFNSWPFHSRFTRNSIEAKHLSYFPFHFYFRLANKISDLNLEKNKKEFQLIFACYCILNLWNRISNFPLIRKLIATIRFKLCSSEIPVVLKLKPSRHSLFIDKIHIAQL